MPELNFEKEKIPLWNGSDGSIAVTVNSENADAALVLGSNPIVDASFTVDGNGSIGLGSVASVMLTVNSNEHFRLAPLWKDHVEAAPDLAILFSLGDSLTPEEMLLAMSLGASADLSAAGSFKYNILTIGASLAVGTDAALVQVRKYPANTPLGNLFDDFFGKLQLPANVAAPPEPGELIAFEFGGYLNFGVSASAGFEMKGTKSFAARDLKLSEVYGLSVTGKIGAEASLAGRFSVEVRAGSDPKWASVKVRRSRKKEFDLTADLKVGATLESQGLPPPGKEFLGALIGIRAKNWLNLIDSAVDQVGKIPSLDDLKPKLDKLAGDFMAKYLGKDIDKFTPGETAAALDKLQKAIDSYRMLDKSATSLYDRYFDPVLNKIPELESRLAGITNAFASWENLKGEADPMSWNIVSQLTDGDPLIWALGSVPGTNQASLDLFLKRANGALSLIRDPAHKEIRDLIELSKSEFGLDRFLGLLDSVDTADQLKAAASTEIGHFIERLLNVEIEKLNAKDRKKALHLIQKVAKAKDAFWQKFDNALTQAAKQSLSLAITGAYSNSDERTALIDLEIRLQNDDGTLFAAGRQFMEEAGRGDFRRILANYHPDAVRLSRGSLTHNLNSSSGIKISVAGWHLDYQYEEMYKVIVNAEQQIRPTATGSLNVFTKADMTDHHERRRKSSKSEQDMHTRLILTFLGETHNAEAGGKFDESKRVYLIDAITSQSASYEATFTDSNTTQEELSEMFLFAKTLGLDAAGATEAGVAPVLTLKHGHYGPITAEYSVRFAPEGLAKLFKKARPDLEADIRRILSRIVLANYLGKGTSVADIAWLYVNDDVKELYHRGCRNFVNVDSILGDALDAEEIRAQSPIEGIQPSPISNSTIVRSLAAKLFDTEDKMVAAFRELQRVLCTPGQIQLDDLRKALESFGKVLNAFDEESLGDNSTFAVFDGLIQLETPARDARSSALALITGKDGQTHNLVFLLNAPALAGAAVGKG